jgi:hypothetical protein
MIYQVFFYTLHYLAFQNHLQEPAALLILNLLQLVRLIKTMVLLLFSASPCFLTREFNFVLSAL